MALSEIAERVKNLTSKRLKVGWLEGKSYPGTDTTVAEVAIWQEFGTKTIPARPFMRPAIADNKDKWFLHAEYVAGNYIRGISKESQVFDYIGNMIRADIQQAIENVPDDLSDITLLLRKWRDEGRTINKTTVEEARRALTNNPNLTLSKNTTALQDTHNLIGSITHAVIDK